VEFPRVDPRRIGLPARHLLTAATWLKRGARGDTLYHGLQMRDLDGGGLQRYDYGEEMVVEEHVWVPKPGGGGELDAWLLGTCFDARGQRTLLNLLDARRLADGPIAQAALPYALPLGFHGNFTPV
jgi:carotenoid cleavage dioxygenase